MRTRTKTLAAALCCVLHFTPAAAAPPTPASVEKLLTLMETEKLLDAAYAQWLPAMKAAFRQSLPAHANAAEALRSFDAAAPRIEQAFREEMAWPAMKDDFVRIYAETFTQEEVNGLTAFYESPLGRAYLAKMPAVTGRSLMLSRAKMESLTQKLLAIIRESARDAAGAADGGRESAGTAPSRISR